MTVVPLFVSRAGRRALVLSALAGAFLALLLGLAADQAHAAYTARVDDGTLRISGDSESDLLVIRPQAGAPDTLEVDVAADGTADFSFDRNTFTAIEVKAGGGDDEVFFQGSFDEQVTVWGGAGNDTLAGGFRSETLIGGGGDDTLIGGDSNDLLLGGGGADRFVWNPGDDNDVIEGESGADALDFNGANVGESIDVSAIGSRVRFFRNVASIALDIAGVETIGYDAFGGADLVVVNDLAGTDVDTVAVDLAVSGGGGDALADTVLALGTEGPDHVTATSSPGTAVVSGLATELRVANPEDVDNVNVGTLGGDDSILGGVDISGPEVVNADGGAGADTATYRGTAGADSIALFANGVEVTAMANNTARLDTLAVESIVVLGLGDADTISAVGNLAALTAITMDGGEGADTVLGGNGPDLLLGGSGADLVDGNQGTDQALLGTGDDTFRWDPGDGNDVVEGQGGSDALDFNGANIGEIIDISANGPRLQFFRNIANIVLDADGIETVGYNAFGGADTVTVNDLAGTAVGTVDVDLAAFGGGGDAQADTVIGVGTNGSDRITFSSTGGLALVNGLAARVQVADSEATLDNVNVQALGGDDTIVAGVGLAGPEAFNADGGEGADTAKYSGTPTADQIAVAANGAEVGTFSGLEARLDTFAVESVVVLGLGDADTISAVGNLAPLTALTLDGGDGADVLRGGNGADLLLGGPGGDSLDGNQGIDRELGGADDDRFQWDPGDASDTLEGQGGSDLLDFNGSNAGEAVTVSANGGRVQLTRNIGTVTQDFDNVEGLIIRARGSADTITVDSLAGTDLDTVDLDLSALGDGGAGDAQPDTVVTNGTSGRDVVDVTRSAVEVLISGLWAETGIVGSEAALDTLRVQTLESDDDVTVAPDVIDLIMTVVDLGADD